MELSFLLAFGQGFYLSFRHVVWLYIPFFYLTLQGFQLES